MTSMYVYYSSYFYHHSTPSSTYSPAAGGAAALSRLLLLLCLLFLLLEVGDCVADALGELVERVDQRDHLLATQREVLFGLVLFQVLSSSGRASSSSSSSSESSSSFGGVAAVHLAELEVALRCEDDLDCGAQPQNLTPEIKTMTKRRRITTKTN